MRSFVAALVVLSACEADAAPCADASVPSACADTETPDYATLYASVLRPSCAIDGPSCHGRGSDRRLSFVDLEASRAYLEAHLVTPGLPACSELYLRVVSTESPFRMPPAEPLPESSRCAIARWIEAGAP